MNLSKDPFTTVTLGLRGYFAVLMTFEDDLDCHTPFNSSFFSYSDSKDAIEDAKQWAIAEQIEYKPIQDVFWDCDNL